MLLNILRTSISIFLLYSYTKLLVLFVQLLFFIRTNLPEVKIPEIGFIKLAATLASIQQNDIITNIRKI